MTDDQHQPAAVAPGLSEDEIARLRQEHYCLREFDIVNDRSEEWDVCPACSDDWPCSIGRLLAALDATRADLARARAEAETLLATMGASTLRCLELEHQRDEARAEAANLARGLVWAHYELAVNHEPDTLWLMDLLAGLLAGKTADESSRVARRTPQPEQPQPAAPGPEGSEPCHVCGAPVAVICDNCLALGWHEQPAAPVDPRLGDGNCWTCSCTGHPSANHQCVQNAAWNAAICRCATAPPDHQAAGDE